MIERIHLLARAVILRQQADGPAVLLAQQISAAHAFLPGGHVEPGESLMTTLVRELAEETGLAGQVVDYLGAVEHQWPEAAPRHYEVNHLFLVQVAEALQEVSSREPHLRFWWCPAAALADHRLRSAPLPRLIERYLAGDRRPWWATTLPVARPGARPA
jgi:8-oxo-dGTP pyrophosphatase MutT (NUDIX family)